MTVVKSSDHHQSKTANGEARGDSMEQRHAGGANANASSTAAHSRDVKPLEQMRAYRACLNCRSRKSRCDLDINGGRPPCRRCTRENRGCILGESHRGGRRVRKQKLVEEPQTTPANTVPFPSPKISGSSPFSPRHGISHLSKVSEPYQHTLTPINRNFSWQQPSPPGNGAASDVPSNHYDQLLDVPPDHPPFRSRDDSGGSSMSIPSRRVREGIASADLQNPSDALDILAQVADRAEDSHSMLRHHAGRSNEALTSPPHGQTSKPADQLAYKPFTDGILSLETIHQLIATYEVRYHPYFPIIPQVSFERGNLTYLSHKEPHLLSAILTIASKQNETVHRICYDHTQSLISMLLTGADAGVEAVEALLLLSQWVSHRPQASVAVGRGEEDRVAWMYIGTALRLAYYIGLDRTSFKKEKHDESTLYDREKLAWCACYYCDRSISIRVGKGFWSRGPTEAQISFPTMRSRLQDRDDWALIFKAHLDLTQIFGNAHDILYSCKGFFVWKRMLEGRYSRYIDDFVGSIRNWEEKWRDLDCSANLRAALFMTYDYLRLYVNAFAYQATMFRALSRQRDSVSSTSSSESQPLPIPQINASFPDARFIYEAIDAAKSLLSRYNSFPDPEALTYMPLSNDLYIIYSAVFLYKARITTTMAEDERSEIRSIVKETINRLQIHSFSMQHMGPRYARLLNLLWRRTPRSIAGDSNHPSNTTTTQQQQQPRANNESYHMTDSKHLQVPPSKHLPNGRPLYPPPPLPSGGQPTTTTRQLCPPVNGVANNNNTGNIAPSTFSWLDLGATWNFATQNNGGESIGGSGSSNGEVDDEFLMSAGGGGGVGGGPGSGVNGGGGGGEALDVQMGLPLMTADYSLLESDNPNFIF